MILALQIEITAALRNNCRKEEWVWAIEFFAASKSERNLHNCEELWKAMSIIHNILESIEVGVITTSSGECKPYI